HSVASFKPSASSLQGRHWAFRLCRTSPARCSTFRCLEMPGRLRTNGLASSVTEASPWARRARIARRVGSARAANVTLNRSSVMAFRYLANYLNGRIRRSAGACQGGTLPKSGRAGRPGASAVDELQHDPGHEQSIYDVQARDQAQRTSGVEVIRKQEEGLKHRQAEHGAHHPEQASGHSTQPPDKHQDQREQADDQRIHNRVPEQEARVGEDTEAGEQKLDEHRGGYHVGSPHEYAAGGFPHLGVKPNAGKTSLSTADAGFVQTFHEL